MLILQQARKAACVLYGADRGIDLYSFEIAFVSIRLQTLFPQSLDQVIRTKETSAPCSSGDHLGFLPQRSLGRARYYQPGWWHLDIGRRTRCRTICIGQVVDFLVDMINGTFLTRLNSWLIMHTR